MLRSKQFQCECPFEARAIPTRKWKSFEEEVSDRIKGKETVQRPLISALNYPSYAVRVFLVATCWAIPGFLATLMLNIFIHFHDPMVAATAGSLVSAIIGGLSEQK